MRPTDLPGGPAYVGQVHERVLEWYAGHARDLPWRRPDATPWGIFVCEVMAQQTPLARVEPAWREWLDRWPSPAALAADPPGEAVRAWGRLGYPRRALRLHAAAVAMVEHHGGRVPDTVEALRDLPGVGEYTAAAVACFGYGITQPVVDVNVRRVLARVVRGSEHPAASLTRAERSLATDVLPSDAARAATWNVAAMELGALLCTARNPRCEACPLTSVCTWRQAGRPPHTGSERRRQAWDGTDRQVRGRLLQALRDSPGPLTTEEMARRVPAPGDQRARCLETLVDDGLVEPLSGGRLRLPGALPTWA